MANVVKRTVKLKKYVDIINEFVAAAAITPGHLVELIAAGTVQKHATAGGNVLPMFALEDELQGKGITDAYAATDPVQVWTAVRGEEVYAILKNGQNVTIGTFLESAGGGELQAHVADTADSNDASTNLGNQIVGVALENVDMSGSDGVDPNGRIKIMVV